MRVAEILMAFVFICGSFDARADNKGQVKDAISTRSVAEERNEISEAVYALARGTPKKLPEDGPVATASRLEADIQKLRFEEESNSPALVQLLVEKYFSKGLTVGNCKLDAAKSKVMTA